MDAVGSSSVNTNYGLYSDYESVSTNSSAETGGASSGLTAEDSGSIGSFASGKGTAELNDLYGQRNQAESELGEITAQKNSAQTKINARKQELTQNRQGGEEFASENEALGKAQELYAQTVSDRDAAQQALNQARQESGANDQAISANAQQRQSVSSQLSSAQSQLASLKAPSKSGGENGEANSNYEAEYSAYESQRSALQAQVSELQQRLQQLQAEAQQLQNTKTQLDRQLNSKQSEVAQLDSGLQSLQSELDGYYQEKAEGNAGLGDDFALDGELQDLQSELESLQQQEAEKQAAVAELNAQIADAEANDEGLQTVREEAADRAFQEASGQIGFDAAGAEAQARSSVAQEQYGKPYEELTEEEKLAIEVRVDGEVTLEAMELARQKLEEDPDNAAAQAVIERGANSLEAQAQLAQARFNNSIEALPESLREGAAAAMNEARGSAAEGVDPEVAAMDALTQYIAENSENSELSPEDISALENIVGAAGAYADAVETADKGVDVVDKAAESFAKSDLAAMKADLAGQLGVSPDQLIVLSGTDGDDNISIGRGENGGLCVTIGDKVYNYTAEEAKYLIIDGGAGNDYIWAEEEGDGWLKQDLHIFGGAGNDDIGGGDGSNLIYGGDGDDELYGGMGNDQIHGGAGNDIIEGYDGDDFLSGGDGNDEISASDGNNVIDGGDGDDILDGGSGADLILGGAGNDSVEGGMGDDCIDGGDGDDVIKGQAGSDVILGGAGNDLIEGGDGCDAIDGGDGNDTIYGETYTHGYTGYADSFDDIILGGAGEDTIDGGEGSDIILGEGDSDNIKGGYGNDVIDGGEGYDTITGHVAFDGNSYGEDYVFDGGNDAVYNGQLAEGSIGVSREDFEAAAAASFAGASGVQDFSAKVDVPEGGIDDPASGDLFGGIKDAYSGVSPFVKPALSLNKCRKGLQLIYQGPKIATSGLSKFMGTAGKFMGAAGGAISVFSGIYETYKGIESGDTAQIVSGSLQTVSGGLAIAAVAASGCPPLAAGLWIASGVTALGSWIASWF